MLVQKAMTLYQCPFSPLTLFLLPEGFRNFAWGHMSQKYKDAGAQKPTIQELKMYCSISVEATSSYL